MTLRTSPSFLSAAAAAFAFAATMTTAAASQPAESTDDVLLRNLLGEPAAAPEAKADVPAERADEPPVGKTPSPDVDAATVSRINDLLAEATQLLGEGVTGDETREVQKGIVDDLARLIEAAKQPPASGSPGNEQGRDATAGGSAKGGDAKSTASGGSGTGTPVANRDGKAEESSDRAGGGRRVEGVRPYRSDLARGEWGHLPPRIRERLLNAGSERYLPRYDGLVRRYFETLADPEPPRPAVPDR